MRLVGVVLGGSVVSGGRIIWGAASHRTTSLCVALAIDWISSTLESWESLKAALGPDKGRFESVNTTLRTP